MIRQLLIAWPLMGVCVAIHAAGLALAVRRGRREPRAAGRFWVSMSMFIRLAAWFILLHLVQIIVWALCYVLSGSMPDLASALYFSAVTYTTTGYGDLVLPNEWRLIGAVEALTGILMCGLSTAFFFAAISRMITDPPAGARPA